MHPIFTEVTQFLLRWVQTRSNPYSKHSLLEGPSALPRSVQQARIKSGHHSTKKLFTSFKPLLIIYPLHHFQVLY